MAGFARSYDAFRPVLVEVAGDEPIDEPPAGSFERLAAALIAALAGRKAVGPWLTALRDAGLLAPEVLAEATPSETQIALGELLRSPKPRTLVGLLRGLAARIVALGGETALGVTPTEQLREDWRSLRGLGATSVDALLVALGRPTYPVDRATYRILVRHGWIDDSAEYDEARSVAEAAAPDSPADLALVSAAFDRIGSRWCKPARPLCGECPLAPWLPEGGPCTGAADF